MDTHTTRRGLTCRLSALYDALAMGANDERPTTIYRARREAFTDPPLGLNEVARRIGMSGGILSLIERGRMVPTVAESEAILQALEAERIRRLEPSTLVAHWDEP